MARHQPNLFAAPAKVRKSRAKPTPIPFKVHQRPANTMGGEAWIVQMFPEFDAHKGYEVGMPFEFRDWTKAAIFVAGLQRGVVDQRAFRDNA